VFAFIYAIPPFNLSARGYGDLVLVILIANLVPGLGYSIQTGTIHSLMLLLVFPLTPLLLAMMISTNLKDYLKEMISGEKSLVIMLGWKLAMDMHDWLVLAAYLFIGIASLIGLSWNLVWPMLLTAPISVFTVYEILRIKSGTKPRWTLLSLGGYAGIGCMLYVLLFTLWLK
jgi:1,4-dihydroxy-2-naphthoate octaprenyltransferase